MKACSSLILNDIFSQQELDETRYWLALVGYPLTHSKSHEKHNKVFKALGFPALYGKKPLLPDALPCFLEEAKALGCSGLSVTMPFKEAIIPYIDVIDPLAQAIGAVNTVAFREGKLYGYNTDAAGALRALKEVHIASLKNKRVVILGAGGVVKAVTHVLTQEGADILILNRTLSRAQQIADHFGCECGGMHKVEEALKTADIFIQCTPVGTDGKERAIDPSWLNSEITVFEVVNQPSTMLLEDALKVGCPIVKGVTMWVYQAIEQYGIWFGGEREFQVLESKLVRDWNQSGV